MAVNIGVPALDRLIGGGIPEKRSVLLTGGPGSGKTTLAMQYLQTGLSRGERCLFVTTEQTPAELQDSFAPYNFDIEHENLTVASIHARPGYSIEQDDNVLKLDTLGDLSAGVQSREETAFKAPFTSQYVQDFLERYGPCDRVVFDSVSGLAAVADNDLEFRRAVLDLIQLFTERFGATTLFTAEETGAAQSMGSAELLRYHTHGVVRLWRERIEGDYHRFVRIEKMRGVDHATDDFEIEFDAEGVHVHPMHRVPTSSLEDHSFVRTGISGLDKTLGGGLIKGGTALVEHDGRANVDSIVTNTIIEAVREERAIVLLPPANLSPGRLDNLIGERVGTVQSLLDKDQLFILDLVGGWENCGENVFTITERERMLRDFFGGLKPLVSWKMKRIFSTMNERRGDRSAVAIVFTEAMLQEFDPKEVRQLYYWARKRLFVEDDTVLFVQNPGVMENTLAEFFVYDARQVLKTWMHDNGLQYVKLEKSPTGHLGSTQLFEHVDYPPYVRIQRPQSVTAAKPSIADSKTDT